MTRVVAYVPDLMDRSRFGAVDEVTFVAGPAELFTDPAHPETAVGEVVYVVDLGRPGVLDALTGAPPGARVIGYASHVDRALIDGAEALGVEVHPRSRFFGQLPGLLG